MRGLMNLSLKKGFAFYFSLGVLAMIWIFFLSPLEAVPGGKDWFGTVTIWETLNAEYGGSTQMGPDEKKSGECTDTLEAMAILQYCSGRFHLEGVTYSDIHRGSAKGIHRRQSCSRGPKESWACDELNITKCDTKEEPRITDGFNVGPEGTYMLQVGGNIRGIRYQFSVETGKKGCGEEDEIRRMLTVPFGGAMDELSREETTRWEPVLAYGYAPDDPDTIRLPAVVSIIWPIGFLANGRVSDAKGNVIQEIQSLPPTRGSSEPACHPCTGGTFKKPDKNRFEQERKASWFFTTDPCEYVKRELENATKIKETYETMSDNPMTENMDGKAFNKLVKGKLFGGGFAPSAPMGTNPNRCELKGDKEDIKKKHYGCLPGVVFDADIAHEEAHQETCSRLNEGKGDSVKKPFAYENYLANKKNYAADEVKAYNKKIEFLNKWMDKNCK